MKPTLLAVDRDEAEDADARTSLRTIMLPCVVCGDVFPYRYSGNVNVDTLSPIDTVCRSCFPVWYHDWLQRFS